MTLTETLSVWGRRILPFVLFIVAAYVVANGILYAGLGRHRIQARLGDPLGIHLDVDRVYLSPSLQIVARNIKGFVLDASFDAPSLQMDTFRMRGRKCLLSQMTLLVHENQAGTLFPACFTTCRDHLSGEATKPCPAEILSPMLAALQKHFDTIDLRESNLFWSSRHTSEKSPSTTPVLLGLDVTRHCVENVSLVGTQAPLSFTTASFLVFGPATGPDGRPNDGTPRTLQWVGGSDTAPVKVFKGGTPSPCD